MKVFQTDKQEGIKKTLWRMGYNLLPPIRGTGSWMRFLSDDWHEAHVTMGLNLRTRNYVGTIFGGALFSGTDPIYMIQLYNILGKDYIVWDKSATIRFIRPGTSRVKARFLITKEEVDEIREAVSKEREINRTFIASWIDTNGKAIAKIEKTIYIADKVHYKAKREQRAQRT